MRDQLPLDESDVPGTEIAKNLSKWDSAQFMYHKHASEWYDTAPEKESIWETLLGKFPSPHFAELIEHEKERVDNLVWMQDASGLGLPKEVWNWWPIHFSVDDKIFLTVPKGQVTFNAEGVDDESSPYFSRKVHWPGNNKSGVTIGRGYDLGSRTKEEVYSDLTECGVSDDVAKLISNGAGKKGDDANVFVNSNREQIEAITREQQYNLFLKIYPMYEERTITNYEKWTEGLDRIDWSSLDPKIQDILVDFVYQGFTKGPKPMRKGMNNDKNELIEYINNSTVMKRYEDGRNRVKYLED